MGATPTGTEIKCSSNADIKRGQLFIFIGDKPVAFASNASLTLSGEITDTFNKMSGDWGCGFIGKHSFSISTEGLLIDKKDTISYQHIVKSIIDKTVLDFWFGDVVRGDTEKDGYTFKKDETKPHFTGMINIESLEPIAENEMLAKFAMRAKGVRELVNKGFRIKSFFE